LNPLSLYGFSNITSLNEIRKYVLDITFKCEPDDDTPDKLVPRLEDWEFLNFTTDYMKI